jgi:adenylate cyclase
MAEAQPSLQSSISAYIPLDRRAALLSGQNIDGLREGSALFADISGSTAMAEALVDSLGPLRGADEVSRQLNRTYDALIDRVHGYGGSVIGFSGDAITCWFDGDAGLLAAACAVDMQQAMQELPAYRDQAEGPHRLGIKVSISAGEIQRFIAGDPHHQVFDLIAGSPLERLAQGEHLANVGEIIAASEVVSRLDGVVPVGDWRTAPEGANRFAPLSRLSREIDRKPAELPVLESLDPESLRPWVAPFVYERLRSGQGEFLAELRPATALFLRFGGFDFDRDRESGSKLDEYIRRVQEIIAAFDGSMIQLTVGDKGSYLYVAFGAPRAHEDDAARAVSAALELRRVSRDWIGPVSIGISHGRMRTGAYGSSTMRTYGVLGDETNLAARLMQHASPGTILVSASAHGLAGDSFDWQRREPLEVKGKREPVVVFSPLSELRTSGLTLEQAQGALPIVGREGELAQIRSWLEQASAGNSRLVGICAEAGMGKSRLATEARNIAARFGFEISSGESQSYGAGAGYEVWRPIWQDLFGLRQWLEAADSLDQLERILAQDAPDLVPRLPLLAPLLNIPIPDNELTTGLDAKRRKRALESMLGDYLRASAAQAPQLIILEDAQWIDPLSLDLLKSLARAIGDQPVFILLLFRPHEGKSQLVGELVDYHELELAGLSDDQTEQLIRLKLRDLAGAGIDPPEALIERICATAQGNPFYIEELLNYLHAQHVDLHDGNAIGQIELPTSLTSLILSRIDQLSESEKATLHLASVIGRSFRADWVSGAFPQLQEREQVRADLEALEAYDLTQLESPDPDLSYLFKQILTREVAYESMPFDLRTTLHDQLGIFIEGRYADNIDPFVEALAHHFSLSENIPKQRIYLLKAGERAQHSYANEAALDYFRRALPILSEDARLEVQLRLAEILELVGDWTETERILMDGLERSRKLGNSPSTARYQAELGEFHRKQGDYEEASRWLTAARELFRSSADEEGLGQVIHYEGTLAAQQGDYPLAREKYERSLEIRRREGDEANIANLLNNLGILARYEGDLEEAREFQTQGLELRRALGDRWAIAVSLNNLGNLALDQGQLGLARERLSEALKIQREIGDPWAVAVFSNNLANVVRSQGELGAAAALYRESLLINRQLGDQWSLAYLLEDISCLAVLQDCFQEALLLTAAAEALREAIGAPRSQTEEQKLKAALTAAYSHLAKEQSHLLELQGRSLEPEAAIELALRLPAAGAERSGVPVGRGDARGR